MRLPGNRSRLNSGPIRFPARVRWWCGSRPAPSAAPIFTSWMVSFPTRNAAHSGPRDRRRIVACWDPGAALQAGQRVGIPWLGHTCGTCPYCAAQARICAMRRSSPATRATAASQRHVIADARSAFPLADGRRRRSTGAAAVRRPDRLALAAMAGDRRATRHLWLRRRGPYRRPGGALAGREVYAFTRPGDRSAGIRALARGVLGRRFERVAARRSMPR